MVGEIAFAAPPVDTQIIDQKTRRHHAQAIVHVAGAVQLQHRRVDQRVARAAFAPCGERGIRCRALLPAQRVIFLLERCAAREASGDATGS